MFTQDKSDLLTRLGLGTKQSMTPEGYLLCEEVPIARTGTQQYTNDEFATEIARDEIQGGDDGVIHVDRMPEDVFHPDAIASFQGKPVVDDHPEGEMLTPENYKRYTVGTTLNPRRGEGIMDEFLLADLLIKDAAAISAVRAGKRQISCGYDADYEGIRPGRARQLNIIGNHVAMVDRGRCGPRCSIGDEDKMTKKLSFRDRLIAAFATKDKKGFDEALEEMGAKGETKAEGETTDEAGKETPAGVHIHLHGGMAMTPAGGVKDGDEGGDEENMEEDKKAEKDAEARPPWFDEHVKSNNARFDSIEKMLNKMSGEKTDDEEPFKEEEVAEEGEEEAEGNVIDKDYEEGEEGEDSDEVEEKKGTADKKMSKDKKTVKDKATVDSAGLQPAFREVLAGAEILSPGIKLPTFDSKAVRKSTFDAMCILQRRALMAHAQTQDGAKTIRTLTGKSEFTTRKMTCDAVGTLFRGAVGLAKARNSRGTIDLASVASKADAPKAPTSIAELNNQNRKRFGQNITH